MKFNEPVLKPEQQNDSYVQLTTNGSNCIADLTLAIVLNKNDLYLVLSIYK